MRTSAMQFGVDTAAQVQRAWVRAAHKITRTGREQHGRLTVDERAHTYTWGCVQTNTAHTETKISAPSV